MKKRILLTMLFVIAFSLFAVLSVSAEDYTLVDNLGDPDWYTGNYELITDKESQVVLSNGDGTYTAYPAYYILKYSISVSGGVVTEAYINGFDYSFVNEKTEKNYTAGAIYKIELPNGLTTVKNTYFGHNPKEPNVVEIIMSDSITSIGSHAFRDTTNLKRVVLSKNLTKIYSYAFYNAKGLEEVVFTPGSDEYLDVSEANIFCGCSSLKEADLSTRKIKVLGNSFLSECTNLGKVTLPDCLEEIGYCSLYKCPNLYLASDFLPTSLKKVGFQFLSGCTNSNDVLYFPEGFTGGEDGFTSTHIMATERYKTPDTTLVFLGKITGTINLEQFHASSGCKLTLVFTKNTFSDLNGTVVTGVKDGNTLAFVGKTASTDDTDYSTQVGTLTLKLGNASESNSKFKVDENGNTLYYVNSKSYTVYFCGGEDVEVSYGVRSNVPNSQWGKHFTTSFEFDRQGHMDAGVHYDLTKVVSLQNCGYDGVTENTCVVCDRVAEARIPATGNHTLSQVSSCADKCSVCLLYVQRAEQDHTLINVVTYELGFNNKGVHNSKCNNVGCTYNETNELNPLFTTQGASMPENGNGALAIGYKVDTAALSTYESLTGKSVKYGVFAVSKANLEGKNVFENGVAINGAITADLTSYSFASFDLKVTGFGDTNSDLPLAMGAYVVVSDENTTEYSYMQDDEKGEKVGNYYFVTYNQVVGNTSTEE